MFISKLRDVVVTQYEHGRLAGLLASFWGNDEFDKPALPFDSFVKGVTFHDRGYGIIDNAGIDQVDLYKWISIQRSGLETRYEDRIADILVLLHVRRLLAGDNTPERNALVEFADQRIEQALTEIDYQLETLQRIDAITNFCDTISFNFCFERFNTVTREVYARNDSDDLTPIQFKVHEDGKIEITPWPFNIDSYSGFIVGYQLEGYPDHLEPVLRPFHVVKG